MWCWLMIHFISTRCDHTCPVTVRPPPLFKKLIVMKHSLCPCPSILSFTWMKSCLTFLFFWLRIRQTEIWVLSFLRFFLLSACWNRLIKGDIMLQIDDWCVFVVWRHSAYIKHTHSYASPDLCCLIVQPLLLFIISCLHYITYSSLCLKGTVLLKLTWPEAFFRWRLFWKESQASLDIEKPGREVNCTRFEVLHVAKHKIKRLLKKCP